MDDLIQFLSTILPLIASTLVILVVLINFYFKIRRNFPISVNCWFCNTWSKVAYDNRNSFECPQCSQYNGFTEDGDYNKVIPEQHDEFMNKSTRFKSRKSHANNGLCTLCNNNQQLKIFQLAHFVPMNEDNYDAEIEHFQEQLEKAYKLCKKCDKVLKKTIEKQNAWLFGHRLRNLYRNGITSFNRISENVKAKAKFSLFSKLFTLLSFLLALAFLLVILSSRNGATKTAILKPYLTMLNSFIPANKVIVVNGTKFRVEACLASAGIALQIARMIGGRSSTVKVNCFLCWTILLITSWARFHKNYAIYITLVEIFCCLYLMLAIFFKEPMKLTSKNNGKVMRKIVKNLEYTCTDFSEASDFEDISSSSTKNDCCNKSIYSNHTASNVLNTTFEPSFTTANNFDTTVFNSPSQAIDLNKSLNNLHLGAPSRPRRVLSPPKLPINSWVAGGFWRNCDGFIMPITQRTNLSRSSSESSGFGSQINEPVMAKSLFGDFEVRPTHFRSTTPKSPIFYPNFNSNNMLYLQGDRNFMRSPSLISCRSEPSPQFVDFNQRETYHKKSLFKNWSEKINQQTTQNG